MTVNARHSKFTRFFVDASHTCATGKNTGIERVVRSVLNECDQWCEADGLPSPEVVTHHAGHFYKVGPRVAKHFRWLGAIESNIQKYLPGWYKFFANLACNTLRSTKAKKWFLPEPGHLGAFKLPHNIYKFAIRRSLAAFSKPIIPNSNDLVLLPDAYWTQRGVWTAVASARAKGAMIATVIYDLIPLSHPQYVGTKRMEGFRRYLNQAIENSDLIMAISRTVREDVRAYIIKHRNEFAHIPYDVRHFTLGAEFKLVEGDVRPEVQELFSPDGKDKTPYLMVATFDPRKNHHYLLDAFDQIWKTRDDVRLCLIGRVGSLCDDVMQRIRNHPALNRQLFAFYDIKDAELQHCYKNCRGVVFPSIIEGFGLPIVESLWFGKRTFASNTPIHCEVGGEDCEYFDLNSPASLAEKIENWERIADDAATHVRVRRPTTWEESSKQLVAHCLNVFGLLKSKSGALVDRKKAA